VIIRLFALDCGRVTGASSGFLAGESGTLTVPVPAYLIVHPQGAVVFDTGLNPGLRTGKAALLGALDKDWEIDFPKGAEIDAQLALAGVKPSAIRYVVNSHLHYDHCGGNAFFPDATLIVHAKEWRAAHRPNIQAAGIYNPRDFEHMARVREIDGAFDIFGDGAVIVFPTPGHTPGHQSLKITTEAGTIVLAADCCYLKRTLDTLHLPAAMYNREMMLESLHRLRELQAGGARIFYGHDPEFWNGVPKAPLPVI
jgi:glyoxylase-like metal-dependent hydrolase (beta-lactamase superfamily II)